MPLGLEPTHRSQRYVISFVNSIADAIELLEEAGLDDVGITLDLYHVWDDPDVWDAIGRIAWSVDEAAWQAYATAAALT